MAGGMSQELEFILKVRDEASAALRAAGVATDRLGDEARGAAQDFKDFNKNSNDMANHAYKLRAAFVGLGIGAAVAFAAREGISAAHQFDTTFTAMQTLAGETAESVGWIRDEILSLGPALGRTPQDLAESFQFIASSGYTGAAALEILEASAKGAAIGLGTTKDVSDVVTSAMNAYGAENLKAADAVGILIAAIREGKAEPDEFGASLGRVLGIATAAGVTFQDLSAGIATLSTTGLPAAEGVAALRQILQEFITQSPAGIKTLEKYGLSLDGLQKTLRERGLLAALRELTAAVPQGELNKVISGVEGLNATLQLTGSLAEQADVIFAAVASGGAADLADAFRTLSESDAFQLEQGFALLNAAMIRFGEEVMPIVLQAIASLIDLYQYFFANTAEAENRLAVLRAAIIGVAVAIGAWAAAQGALALAGMLAAIGEMATGFGRLILKVWEAVAVLGVYDGAMYLSIGATQAFKAALISTGIGALVVLIGSLIAWLVTLGDTWFKVGDDTVKGWDIVIAAFKAAGAVINSILAPLIDGFMDFAVGVSNAWNDVAGAVTEAVDDLVGPALEAMSDMYGNAVGAVADFMGEMGINVTTNQGKIAMALLAIRAPWIAVRVAFAAGATFIVEVFKNAGQLISNIVAAISTSLGALARAAWKAIRGDFAGAWAEMASGAGEAAANIAANSDIIGSAMSAAAAAGGQAFRDEAAAANEAAAVIDRALSAGSRAFREHVEANRRAAAEASKPAPGTGNGPPSPEDPPVPADAGSAGGSQARQRATDEERAIKKITEKVEALGFEYEMERQLMTVGFESARQREMTIARLEAENDLRKDGIDLNSELARTYIAAEEALAGQKYDTDIAQDNLERQNELRIIREQGPAYMEAASMFGDAQAIRIAFLDAETAALQRGASAEQARLEAQDAAERKRAELTVDHAAQLASMIRDVELEMELNEQLIGLRDMDARSAAIQEAGIRAVADAHRQGIVDAEAYRAAAERLAAQQWDMANAQESLGQGFTRWMDDMKANAIDAGQVVYDSLSAAWDMLGTALDRMLAGQEVSWGELLAGFAAGIAKMIAQALMWMAFVQVMRVIPGGQAVLSMMDAMAAARTGAATGGAMPSVPQAQPGRAVHPNAKGGAWADGIVNEAMFFRSGSQLGVLGEGSKPEGILPLARTPSGELGVAAVGGGGGGGDTISFGDINVHYTGTGDRQTDMANIEAMKDAVRNVIDERVGQLMRKSAKTGGSGAMAFGRGFGG